MKKNFAVVLFLSVIAALLAFGGGYYLGTQYHMDTYVPVLAQPQPESVPETPENPQTQDTPVKSGKINLNTATAEELMELPGIGEKLSAAIVTYREQIGTFTSIWQLDGVPGIGEKTIQRIEPYLTLS